MYFSNSKKTDSNYKKKLRSLVFNLNNPENTELRFKVISGEITPEKLSKMSIEELAPSKLKKSRNELHNKYLKEQVIKKEDIKLIAKNHKGESIITMDNDAANNESETLRKMNENNIYNKALDIEDDGDNNKDSDSDSVLYDNHIRTTTKKSSGLLKKKESKSMLIDSSNIKVTSGVNTTKTIVIDSKQTDNNNIHISTFNDEATETKDKSSWLKDNENIRDYEKAFTSSVFTLKDLNNFFDDQIKYLASETQNQIIEERKRIEELKL